MADSFFDLRHDSLPVVCRPPAFNPAFNQAVTEAEVMKFLHKTGPIKRTDLVAKFRSRHKTSEGKAGFIAILTKISSVQNTDGANYIVLRAPNQAITEAEERRRLGKSCNELNQSRAQLVTKFRRVGRSEDKMAFAAILKRISRLEKTDGGNYVCLRGSGMIARPYSMSPSTSKAAVLMLLSMNHPLNLVFSRSHESILFYNIFG